MCEGESTMTSIFRMSFLALFFMAGSATAAEPKANGPVSASEPIKCYGIAWGNKENPGLGLTAGQAVMLCSGATDASKVIQCFVKAWAHPDDGGLGSLLAKPLLCAKQIRFRRLAACLSLGVGCNAL